MNTTVKQEIKKKKNRFKYVIDFQLLEKKRTFSEQRTEGASIA